MAKRFSIEAVFKAIDRVTAPVSKMQNKVRKFTRSMHRGFTRVNKTITKFSRGLKTAALGTTLALGLMGAAMGDVITTGADFGRAIGSAAAKFPDKIKRGTVAFKDLELAARRVGSATEFTATEAAKGLNFLAKAGFKAKFSMSILADIVDFATASEMGLAEAADIASDALGAFGLDSVDPAKKLEGMRRIMDVMSLTANSTNTTVTELFEAMKKGGPVADTAGASVESFSAMMGFLASSGIKATNAGTAAKNVFLSLAGVGNKSALVFKKLGISLKDNVTGNLRDQLDVLDELRKKLAPMGSKQRISIISAIFGKIPIAAAAKLVDKAGIAVRGLRKELIAAGGSSKRTAAYIRDDVKGSIDGLMSAIEGVKISIFSLNEGPLKDAIDGMTTWVRTNEKLIAGNIGNFLLMLITNFDQIVTTIKKVALGIAIFYAVATALKAVAAIIAIVNFLMLANPIVLGIMAAVAAVGLLFLAFNKIKNVIRFIGNGVVSAFGALGGLLGFTKDDSPTGPGVVTPQERTAKSMSENGTVNKSEVTLKTGPGVTAEVTQGKLGGGLTLQASGAM